ncbi:hypothetical protein CW751_00585 [Brumimicrobium salinarum]|uniref:Secretion system C-terminal sorting domain-containing protein n=1 Tax=Brumimicrobium salinarum TaxID=2058658 RepID=A0A2I0R5L5_9FLAO|nr:T9SS type A sorting domain-containing protein [Brumimicrobium salinarum]PKR81867.1 hypothetical protein CW751_00585 [Brumimicrobium salinarum]
MMKLSIIPICILFSGTLFAQNEVAYTYDDAGNRIKREGTGSGLIIQPNDLTESTAMENLVNCGIDLQAQPNPTFDKTEVSVLLDQETVSEEHKVAIESGVIMQLVDIGGKIISTKTGKSLRHTFDLNSLSNGIYFVKVFTENEQLVGERKILKE